MTTLHAGFRVEIHAAGRKYELPSPLAVRIRILPGESVRQFCLSRAMEQVLFVNLLCVLKMLDQVLSRACRQHRHAIFAALSAANAYFHSFEIQIFHTKSQTLH